MSSVLTSMAIDVAGPMVDSPAGRISGVACGAQPGVTRFMGLPYAQAPTGAWRLRSPRPWQPWAGTRDGSRPAPASLQTLGGNQVWMNEPIAQQAEDCLYLNVWTPDTKASLPVLFWVHGGQTRNGHGAAPGIDGASLASRGLVVVTINYRLGALGGLAHPLLEDEQSGLCANWGLQDKLAALAWVNQCIASFGGDPARVTLAGQSSGAANAVMIAQHGLGQGQYQRVIAQSPPLFRPPMFVDLAAAAEYTEAFAASLNVSVPGLRDVDGLALQRAEHAFAYSPELTARMGRPRTAPVRDGRLIRDWPFDAPAAPMPVLACWTRSESDFWFRLQDGDGKTISPQKPPQTPEELDRRLTGLMKLHYAFADAPAPAAVVAAYSETDACCDHSPEHIWRDVYTDLAFRAPMLHWLGRQARAGQPAYAAEFAYPMPSAGGGSPHATDVPFVFGTWAHPHFACKIGSAPAVAAVSEAMMSAWVRFASNGDPGAAAGCPWPAFDPAAPRVMRFGPERAAVTELERPAGLACWPAYRA